MGASFIGNCVGRIKTMLVSGPPKPHDLDGTRAWYAHHRAGTLTNERLDALVEKLRKQGIPVSDEDILMMSRAQLFSPKQVQDLINRDMLDPTMMGSMALNDIKVSNADLDSLDKRVLSQWMADTGKGGVGGSSFFVANPALRPELRTAVFGAFMGDYFNAKVAATPNGPQALQSLLSTSYHGMSGVSKIVTPTMQEAERLSLTNVTPTTPPATDAQKAYIAARMKNESWAPQMLKTDFWDDFGKQVYGTVVMTAAGSLGTGGIPSAPSRGKADYSKILERAGSSEKDALGSEKIQQGEHSAPKTEQREQTGDASLSKAGQNESTQNVSKKSHGNDRDRRDGLVVLRKTPSASRKIASSTQAASPAPITLPNGEVRPISYDQFVAHVKANGIEDAFSKPLDQVYNEVYLVEKNLRPDPDTYLTPEFIKRHTELYSDGAARVDSGKSFDLYSMPRILKGEPFGRDDGVYLSPKTLIDDLSLTGNPAEIEKTLGFPDGTFSNSGGMVRTYLNAPKSYNLRLATGRESGANEYWLPGGYTYNTNGGHGVPEMVANPIHPPKLDSTVEIHYDEF